MAEATVNGHKMVVTPLVDDNDRVFRVVAFCYTCSPDGTVPVFTVDVTSSVEIMAGVREAVQRGLSHANNSPSLN